MLLTILSHSYSLNNCSMLKRYGINYYCAHLDEETHLLSLKIILFSPDESHSSNCFVLSSVLLHSWLMDPHEWINTLLLTWRPKNLRFEFLTVVLLKIQSLLWCAAVSFAERCLTFWRIIVPTSSGSSCPRTGPHPEDECTMILQAGSYSPNNKASHLRKTNLQPYNVLLSDEMTKPFKSDTSLQLGHNWCVDHTRSCRLSQQCI